MVKGEEEVVLSGLGEALVAMTVQVVVVPGEREVVGEGHLHS